MPDKLALVLSGGGAKGAFAAGAVKYLMIELGLRFDLVVGTSTGALIAPLVAMGDIANLVHFYENVEQQDILTDRPDLLAFLFSDALNDTRPLERLIQNFFGDRTRYEKLLHSPTEMFVTVVNMQTGEVEYGNPHQDPKPVLLKKILASACVPVMMPPVKIGRYQYVDGGVKEIAPFRKAIEEGATHILSVILSPDARHRAPSRKEFKSSMDILKRTLELLTDEVVDNDLKVANLYSEAIRYLDRIRRNAKEALGLSDKQIRRLFTGLENPFEGRRIVEIVTIRPEKELLESSLEFDPDRMRKMVDMGYKKAKEVMNQKRLAEAFQRPDLNDINH
ncbi:MAG: patatin-like phospholipase family protein [Desulfobacterota bacterium]|nr:patatin-like phospholipase family protein [Thermodesulfobacteriota bacterium]